MLRARWGVPVGRAVYGRGSRTCRGVGGEMVDPFTKENAAPVNRDGVFRWEGGRRTQAICAALLICSTRTSIGTGLATELKTGDRI